MSTIVFSSTGRRFHACGAATGNARSPVFNLVDGTTRSPFEADRRWLFYINIFLDYKQPKPQSCSPTSATGWRSSRMYRVAVPFSARWVRRHTLYSTRARTGSRWSSLSAAVALSLGPCPRWGSWWGPCLLMRFLMRFLILNEVFAQDLIEISILGSGVTTPGQLWAMPRLPFGLLRLPCPQIDKTFYVTLMLLVSCSGCPFTYSGYATDFGTISLRFSMRNTFFFVRGSASPPAR